MRMLLGVIAGLAATTAMTSAMTHLARQLPPAERYPLPPREIVDGLDIETPVDRGTTTLAAHYAFGAVTGALYAVLFRRSSLSGGAAYGAAVWAVGYLGLLPAAGLLSGATRHPIRRSLVMLLAHLVWGVTLAGGVKELEAAQKEVFASGPDRDRAPRHH
jgi:uncharacterized membrane protein YagU involved in acid resistance